MAIYEEGTMEEYKHGSMDVSSHEKYFVGFVRFAFWVCVVAALALVFLAVFNS